MGLRKYADVETTEVLPAEDQERIERSLHRVGKTSAKDLTEDERKRVFSQDE
jgi:hypothetical protein